VGGAGEEGEGQWGAFTWVWAARGLWRDLDGEH
jgi:hypothetical protein